MGSLKYFGVSALLSLAVIAECFGAQDRSRQRSSSGRSVSAAANSKRDTNFDCPEEFGYYPHPTDCTLYYVCVFGGALLESCTGGLMYSHELQTCDWPRNVGCDANGAVVAEDLERVYEREPPPPRPAPRRNPPASRAQPNPVITSRGQPKFSRQEYEKQQQLYAEVDDLPPVEEIETDRQQRVYRGQPSTIGQVQKDRDGYVSQGITSGRNLNVNIIPASLNQNSKIGSFSFGTQVDDRRTATVTPAPQTYSGIQYMTDTSDRLIDISTNDIETENDVNIKKTRLRKKRDTTESQVISDIQNFSNITNRNDDDQVLEYDEDSTEPTFTEYDNEEIKDESERGKRQIRYYLKNGYKSPPKHWQNNKEGHFQQFNQNYNPNIQGPRYQTAFNDHFNGANRNQQYTSVNPYLSYNNENFDSQRPFKPSLPDLNKPKHSPTNVNNQIITKSPPISALGNSGSQYPSLNGEYNNKKYILSGNSPNGQYFLQSVTPALQSNIYPYLDSSHVPSTQVTARPIKLAPTTQIPNKYRTNYNQDTNISNQQNNNINKQKTKPTSNTPLDTEEEYDEDDDESQEDDESSEYDENDKNVNFKPSSANLPFGYTHPSNKFANIENPFARPDFDFDAFLAKLRGVPYSISGATTIKPKDLKQNKINNIKILNGPSVLGFSTSSRPFKMSTLLSDSDKQVQNILFSTTKQPQRFQSNITPQNIQHGFRDSTYPEDDKTSTRLSSLKIKPPNFNDDRQLPINHNFHGSLLQHKNKQHGQIGNSQYLQEISSTPSGQNFQTLVKNNKKQNYLIPDSILSSIIPSPVTSKPNNVYVTSFYNTTPKPLSTLVNQHLTALQQYWKTPATDHPLVKPTLSPSFSDIPNIENIFAHTLRPSSHVPNDISQNTLATTTTTSTKAPPIRKPIPKPSPEMNDYYYDDEDEHYYYEPVVKPKYMPSSEIKPQRPPMAQNDQEYDDAFEPHVNMSNNFRNPSNYNSFKSVTKNHNDVSVVTKTPFRLPLKNTYAKIPVPVMLNNAESNSSFHHPNFNDYSIVPHLPRNRTVHLKIPNYHQNTNTIKPPKYLNQTTLRPYTVRHRLAKPISLENNKNINEDTKLLNRGKIRHQNIVAQMKLTTPSDSLRQETRYTKTSHDDRTNSLQPTESVTPSSYSPSPRPKMLYNSSQAYNPDQYDPYYAVYDEDGELYKDPDYVQQYNSASLRPAVQQTYRGTPPPTPARRPVESYTPRPVLADDYDDALIQGQISNQNQYQTAIRQDTRGDGNELLGYDHIPSNVRTTIYEATSYSTIPSTTSTTTTSTTTTTTTTTTKRPTTAPYTEAITVSRFSPRLSTDEKKFHEPYPDEKESSIKNPEPTISSTFSPVINLSSLAKPFEKTDNRYRLSANLQPTDSIPTHRPSLRPKTNNNNNLEVIQSMTNDFSKKMVSLTTGFSIRHNVNNTQNPYTLTVITKPFEAYTNSDKGNSNTLNKKKHNFQKYYYETDKNSSRSKENYKSGSSRNEFSLNKDTQYDKSNIEEQSKKTEPTLDPPNNKVTTPPPTTETTKYYLKTVIKRPAAPLLTSDENIDISTENDLNIGYEIENDTPDGNKKNTLETNSSKPENLENLSMTHSWDEPAISPYRTLDNLRNSNVNTVLEHTSSIPSSSTENTVISKNHLDRFVSSSTPRKPSSYYSYHILDEDIPDQTTEVFSGKVNAFIKTFLSNNLPGTPKLIEEFSPIPEPEEIVNIGYQNKKNQFDKEKSPISNIKYIQIVNNEKSQDNIGQISSSSHYENNEEETNLNPTIPNVQNTVNSIPIMPVEQRTPSTMMESSTNNEFVNIQKPQIYESKFTKFVTLKPDSEKSRKYLKLVNNQSMPKNKITTTSEKYNDQTTTLTKMTDMSSSSIPDFLEPIVVSDVISDIASTTSTTKSTTTSKNKIDLTITKSTPFPTRATRINPAIKLAAANLGGGRRSYQSSPNCSTDNRLQANPKCNEIKYQRPVSTRGRGSAHYSTSGGSETSQQNSNRGTPPTRIRPTLKPSTSIVSKNVESVDIYLNPPTRPAAVYPQPTPDKTAAKCRKDVCLLPDCFCGGKDIPGNLPVDEVPQIVLITFDDAVNDLNKMYYEELFERGRVNPNGCPITATFYVSHEWTDYSQIQNLYVDGHEFASHTISHSFGEQFSQKKWHREVGGQREILAAYGGVKLEDVRGMRAPFLSVGGNKMFKMLYDSNFTYDSSLPVYENRPPSWPYTLDYKLFHDCMIPPCPTKSYPGVWEVPMVMWQDLNGGRCSMGDACANPPEAENVYKMILKNFDRHYTTNRAPFGLFYHAAWFTQPHHKEGFIMFLDFINKMKDVWIVTNWQALQWVRDPTPLSRLNNFQPFQCNYQDRPKKCNNPKVCNLWHKSGVRYMRTCQPCPEIYPWTGKSGIRSSRIDNDIEEK